ncbi:MAG: carbamate kinase [bacterium]|nr:carbamate kinase [bacterium]
MKLVVALGGNALGRRDAPKGRDVEFWRESVRAAAPIVARLAASRDVVVTHGNGPQVGLLALQAAGHGDRVPLDVLGAESEGMLGYLIERELRTALGDRDVAALLTQVLVRPDDPAFAAPTKPIGPVVSAEEAERLAAARGWTYGPTAAGLRRLVPSPMPCAVLERSTIRLLMRLGVVVVCAGGGGIPVAEAPDGTLHGVEAVVDKDASSALVATDVGAERLLLLTNVPAVYADWPTAREPIESASPRALAALGFEEGSMAPKVEAACRFVKQTGGTAHIGALEDAVRMLSGKAGTRIEPGNGPVVSAGG